MTKNRFFEWDGKLCYLDENAEILGSLTHSKDFVLWETKDGRSGKCEGEGEARQQLQGAIVDRWPLAT